MAARDAIRAGERDPDAIAALARAELARAEIEPEYFELVAANTMAPIDTVDGDVLAVVAARVGRTRLIDNELILTNEQPSFTDHEQPISTTAVAGTDHWRR
jgi:pantothenate synthetase